VREWKCPKRDGEITLSEQIKKVARYCGADLAGIWELDPKSYMFWRENGTDCANCVAACPWAFPIRPWL